MTGRLVQVFVTLFVMANLVLAQSESKPEQAERWGIYRIFYPTPPRCFRQSDACAIG